jgi:hypothetical protein
MNDIVVNIHEPYFVRTIFVCVVVLRFKRRALCMARQEFYH